MHRVRTALRDSSPGSLGFATFPREADTAEALAGIADRRLYADKAARHRRVPGADAVTRARAGVRALDRFEAVSARERRRHSIADPGWMSIAQTGVGLIYVLRFADGHPYRLGVLLICLWGFGAGAPLIAVGHRRAGRLRSRRVQAGQRRARARGR